MVIGSVTAEFFVTVAAATTFFVELGLVPMQALVGLTVGGVVAAPLGAYLARKVAARPLMAAVGLLVVGLAGFQSSSDNRTIVSCYEAVGFVGWTKKGGASQPLSRAF
jgi:uncharacterized membrane protein YfcA